MISPPVLLLSFPLIFFSSVYTQENLFRNSTEYSAAPTIKSFWDRQGSSSDFDIITNDDLLNEWQDLNYRFLELD